jgi:colanic acid biosynthesis glycosyl transferase WcaI
MASGLPNVRFLDLLPAARLNGLLNMADIHLLPQLRGAADLVMPSKLVGMLASGKPVIAAGMPGSEMAAVVTGRGLVIEPECPDVLAQAILTLAQDPERRLKLGAAGRAFAQSSLDAEAIFDRLDMRLETLCNPHYSHVLGSGVAMAREVLASMEPAAVDAPTRQADQAL